MYMIFFVLHDPACCDQVMTAWEETGVGGVTIFPSTGMERMRSKGAWRDDLPLIPSLMDFKNHVESLNRTLVTVVRDEEIVDKIVQVTQEIVGDLSQPETGLLIVLPVARAYGLSRNSFTG